MVYPPLSLPRPSISDLPVRLENVGIFEAIRAYAKQTKIRKEKPIGLAFTACSFHASPPFGDSVRGKSDQIEFHLHFALHVRPICLRDLIS